MIQLKSSTLERGIGMFKSSSKGEIALWILVILWLIALAAYIVARPIDKALYTREVEGIVTEKAVKNNRNQGTYLVFIEDETGSIIPLEVTDSLLRWRFNSSDVWGNIHEGQKYIFEVGGSRVEFMSWYPNIYSYHETE